MAVYTDVSAEDLGRFLAGYDLGELLSYKGIAEGVENSNFLVHTGTGHYILTLYEKRVAARRCAVLPGADGASGVARHHLSAAGAGAERRAARHACAAGPPPIVTFLDGMWMRRPDAGHCAAVGEALARMHLAGADFAGKRRNALSVDRLAAAVRAGGRPRRQRAARPARRDRAELGHLETSLAARPAAGRDPRRSVSRQRVLPERQAVRPDRLLFRLHRYARLSTSPSASTPGASSPIIPTTSPRAATC